MFTSSFWLLQHAYAVILDVFRHIHLLWNCVQIISTDVQLSEWIKMCDVFLQNNTCAAVLVVHLHFERSPCHHFRLMQACSDTVWGHDETQGASCFCFTDFCFPFQNKTFNQAATLRGYTAPALCQSPPLVKSTWEWKQHFLFICWQWNSCSPAGK